MKETELPRVSGITDFIGSLLWERTQQFVSGLLGRYRRLHYSGSVKTRIPELSDWTGTHNCSQLSGGYTIGIIYKLGFDCSGVSTQELMVRTNFL